VGSPFNIALSDWTAPVSQLTHSVAEILGRPGEYRDFTVRGTLAGVRTPLARVDGAPVTAALRAESVVEGILVTGAVDAMAVLECARCLTDFETAVPLERVCELFLASGHELPAEEDAYEISGLEIDLEPLLRDELMLALPLNPLCAPDCRGLCPQCGQNFNEGSCDCTEDDSDPRWAALAVIREQLEKTQG